MRNKIIEAHYSDNRDILVKVISRRIGYNIPIAEEIVQEAYSRALRYWATFDSDNRSFTTWFRTILNNACRDAQDVERSYGVVKDVDEVFNECSQYSSYKLNKIKGMIEDVKGMEEKEIIHMYFNLGFTPAEIREVVNGYSIDSIKSRVKRFKKFVEESYVERT